MSEVVLYVYRCLSCVIDRFVWSVTLGLSASEAAGNTAAPVRYVNHHGNLLFYNYHGNLLLYDYTIIRVHSVLCTSVVR